MASGKRTHYTNTSVNNTGVKSCEPFMGRKCALCSRLSTMEENVSSNVLVDVFACAKTHLFYTANLK